MLDGHLSVHRMYYYIQRFFLNTHASIFICQLMYHVKKASELRQQSRKRARASLINPTPDFSTGMTRATGFGSLSGRVTPSSSLITSRSPVVTFCYCVRRFTCYRLLQPTTLATTAYTFTYSRRLHSYTYTTYPPCDCHQPSDIPRCIRRRRIGSRHRPHLHLHLATAYLSIQQQQYSTGASLH